MVHQQQRPAGSTFILDKLIAVVLVIWLLFGGGFSQVKTWLTPDRLNQVGQIADTIKTGAGRVVAPNAAPAARPGAPVVPRVIGGGAPAGQPPINQVAAEQAADAAYQATAQAAEAQAIAARATGNLASAPAPINNALPTAVVLIPTVPPLAQITIVPQSMPVVYAQSDLPQPTPIPTLAYPTPLPVAAAAYTLSPDGLCVTVTRDGAAYQQCQDWKYSPAEAASVADYLRTGLLPGTKVQ